MHDGLAGQDRLCAGWLLVLATASPLALAPAALASVPVGLSARFPRTVVAALSELAIPGRFPRAAAAHRLDER